MEQQVKTRELIINETAISHLELLVNVVDGNIIINDKEYTFHYIWDGNRCVEFEIIDDNDFTEDELDVIKEECFTAEETINTTTNWDWN